MTEAAKDERGYDDLDPSALLDALADADQRARQAEVDKLLIAHQWAVLHPATEDTGTSTWGGDSFLLADESLGGDGTPRVAAFTAEPLAVTLGISPASAAQLIAEALDLRHRLPETWAKVETLEVPAWKARQVARTTHSLSRDAAGWVDQQIAPRLKRCGARLLDTLTAQAIAKFDPHQHAEMEQAAKHQQWDVTLYTPPASEYAATSELHITGDTPTLTDLYRRVCAHAAAAGKAGDQNPLGVRKVHALADLFNTSTGGRAASEASDQARSPTPQTVLYLHLDKTDLDDALVKVGRAERLGPLTTDQIRTWLGNTSVRIQPVIRIDGDDAVNGHDPPDPMRDQVILRDPVCVFPGCQVDARRCDLDHIDPYDPNGPPGQTRPSNLAPLCRRHHRAKTSGLWRYTRTPQGGYLWSGPYLRHAVG